MIIIPKRQDPDAVTLPRKPRFAAAHQQYLMERRMLTALDIAWMEFLGCRPSFDIRAFIYRTFR